MFFKKHKHHQDDRIESLIGGGTVVTGDICFSGGLRIDGKVIEMFLLRMKNPGLWWQVKKHILKVRWFVPT